jgi:hypothetical protein
VQRTKSRSNINPLPAVVAKCLAMGEEGFINGRTRTEQELELELEDAGA